MIKIRICRESVIKLLKQDIFPFGIWYLIPLDDFINVILVGTQVRDVALGLLEL